MTFIKIVRENLTSIFLFSSILLVIWRIHEYAHLVTANILGIKIIMSLNTWISSRADVLLMGIGPLSTAILSLLGGILVFRSDGIWKVIGFYLTFNGFLLTLSSVVVRLNQFTGISFLNEYTWKLTLLIPIAIILALEVIYGGLNLKLSCVFWLTIIALITGLIVITLDLLFWWLYKENILGMGLLFGQITPVYLIDLIVIAMLLILARRLGRVVE